MCGVYSPEVDIESNRVKRIRLGCVLLAAELAEPLRDQTFLGEKAHKRDRRGIEEPRAPVPAKSSLYQSCAK
jgi:hypothetical protein